MSADEESVELDEVAAQVSSGDDVLPAAEEAQPDVALLDIERPGIDGIEAAARLRRELPECRILMLTTFGRAAYLRRAWRPEPPGSSSRSRPRSGSPRLHLSEGTVRNYLSTAIGKTGARNRTEAWRIARDRGWL
jgi:two-component system response regulator DesR